MTEAAPRYDSDPNPGDGRYMSDPVSYQRPHALDGSTNELMKILLDDVERFPQTKALDSLVSPQPSGARIHAAIDRPLRSCW